MPKEIPHPSLGSPAPSVLKHSDHSHGHCIFILMLRFFLNLLDLNGCGEVKQAECPPILRGLGGEGASPVLPSSSPLPSPTTALKHLLQVISTFVKRPISSEGPGDSPRSQQRRQSEGYIADRETDMGIRTT